MVRATSVAICIIPCPIRTKSSLMITILNFENYFGIQIKIPENYRGYYQYSPDVLKKITKCNKIPKRTLVSLI